jgi:energy-coupling factor transport system permease protein
MDTLVHRLDPRVKFFIVLAFTVLSLLTVDLAPMALLFFSMVAVATVSGVLFHWLNMLKKFALFLVIVLVLDSLFPRVSYPPVYFTVDIWSIHSEVTYGGLLFSATMGFRLLDFVGISMLFIMSTRYEDFIKALRKLHVPYTIAFSLGLALRAMTYVGSDVRGITDAQRSRCLELEKGGLLSVPNRMLALFVPMTTCLLKRSANISEAMMSRGFGYTKTPTMYKGLKLKKTDYVFIAGTVALTAVLLLL